MPPRLEGHDCFLPLARVPKFAMTATSQSCHRTPASSVSRIAIAGILRQLRKSTRAAKTTCPILLCSPTIRGQRILPNKRAAHIFMASGDNYPIKAKVSSWRRWEDEFNAGFAGKSLVYGVQVELAHPVRLTGSLNTRSHRCWHDFQRLPPAFQPAAPNKGYTHPRERRS
jgi:hypothetical protein